MTFLKKNQESSKFINQLTQDINLLERLISENILEDYDRIGAEQEFCLIDENFRANPINEKIVKKLKKSGFVTEIAKFNMELNIEPIDLKRNAKGELVPATGLNSQSWRIYKPNQEKLNFKVSDLVDASHHMGGLSYPNIVDKNLKIKGLNNIYCCSSAIFPTSGSANPTLIICGLAERLSKFLQ